MVKYVEGTGRMYTVQKSEDCRLWAEEHPRSYMVQDKLVQNLVAVLFCGLKMLGLETIEAYVMWHLFTEFGGN